LAFGLGRVAFFFAFRAGFRLAGFFLAYAFAAFYFRTAF
jgi:hypothetical protein